MANARRDESGLTATYEICVRGELGGGWSDWFAGPVVTGRDGGETVITGVLDQAALHAVLRRIRDMALPLVSVRRIEPDGAARNKPIESKENES
jgi:hypothetical protein